MGRTKESDRIRKKYPERIPVICEKDEKSPDLPQVDKNKYLVPKDLTIAQFIYVIRKRIKLPPEKAIFLYVNNSLPQTTSLLAAIYEEHKSADGFLYVNYAGENTFGN